MAFNALREDLAKVEAGLKSDIAQVRLEIKETETALKADLAKVEADLKLEIAFVKKDIEGLKVTLLLGIPAITGGIVGLFMALSKFL